MKVKKPSLHLLWEEKADWCWRSRFLLNLILVTLELQWRMFSRNRRINGRPVNEDLVRNDRLPVCESSAPAFHVWLTCMICKHVRLSTFLRRQDCRTTGLHLRFRDVTPQRCSNSWCNDIKETRQFVYKSDSAPIDVCFCAD